MQNQKTSGKRHNNDESTIMSRLKTERRRTVLTTSKKIEKRRSLNTANARKDVGIDVGESVFGSDVIATPH